MKKISCLFFVFALIFTSGCSYCNSADTPVSGEEIPKQVPVKTVTISAAGDCTLGTDVAFGGLTFPVEVKTQNEDYGWFFRRVLPIFSEDDLTIVNLEGTLTHRGVRQDKTFAFRGDPAYTKILNEGSVEAVTLANNHSQDYGEVSFEDTKTHLDQADIIWFENLTTRVVEKNGISIGLIGLYDLNGTASQYLPQAMADVKEQGAQIVVVQVHWGIEGKTVPESSQRQLAHAAIDAGADLVIGHHPHVMQGLERYRNKMIVYSLGNFCFGGNQNPRDKDCMIFQQTFQVKGNSVLVDENWKVYPCSISSVSGRNNYQPTPLTGEEGERVRNKIQSITDSIGALTVRFGTVTETQ